MTAPGSVARDPSHPDPPRGLRRFLLGWTASMLAVFAALGIAYLITSARLGAVAAVILTDSKSLEADHRFELALLAQRRDALLWHLTGEDRHRIQGERHLEDADGWIARLSDHVTTIEETKLVTQIEEAYRAFRSRVGTSGFDDLQSYVDDVLHRVEQHRELNARQMASSLAAGEALARRARVASLVISLVGAVVLALGVLGLWRRVLRPALSLTEAAADLARGDLEARAGVSSDDEMGTLVRTFNSMADAVRDRERERFEFVAGVAHDLKSPLVAIGGGARRLLRDEVDPEDRRVWMDIIVERTGFMESLVDDLTDSIQVQAGRLVLHRGPFDLAEMVTGLVRRLGGVIDTHELRFGGADPCPMVGDRRRLERVLMNLVSNAVKYSPRGAEVLVALEADADRAVLRVEDRGAGIDPADLARIFEPFTRLDHTREMARGTGLGLTIVKKVVEAHGGRIRIDSALGRGTTVTVEVPRGDPERGRP